MNHNQTNSADYQETKQNIQCLIVDDEIELAQSICTYLSLYEIAADYVTTASACLDYLQSTEVSMLLLDINLEKESGFLLCKQLRTQYDIPILFLSARDKEEDIVLALNIGGDDYITKPCSMNLLLAKVQSVLRRIHTKEPERNCYLQIGSIRLNIESHQLYVNDKEVSIKTMEYKLLRYLMEHKDAVIEKRELFDQVWGDSFFSDGTLNVHIRWLREKIEPDPNHPIYIKTIWGVGYTFVSPTSNPKEDSAL